MSLMVLLIVDVSPERKTAVSKYEMIRHSMYFYSDGATFHGGYRG